MNPLLGALIFVMIFFFGLSLVMDSRPPPPDIDDCTPTDLYAGKYPPHRVYDCSPRD